MSKTNGFHEAIGHEESLEIFLRKMQEFDRAFCDAMASGTDFTIRLEVHGNRGEVLHVRLYKDDREQPRGAQKRIDEKMEE